MMRYCCQGLKNIGYFICDTIVMTYSSTGVKKRKTEKQMVTT